MLRAHRYSLALSIAVNDLGHRFGSNTISLSCPRSGPLNTVEKHEMAGESARRFRLSSPAIV